MERMSITVDLGWLLGILSTIIGSFAMLWIKRLDARLTTLDTDRVVTLSDIAAIKARLETIDASIGELHAKVDRIIERRLA